MNNLFTFENNSQSPRLACLASDHTVLHFDDFPILFYGKNAYGNKIIGSHLDEDYENKKLLRLHTIVSDRVFFDFISQKITYLELLRSSTEIFLIKESFDLRVTTAHKIDFGMIPLEYLPTNKSFCPKQSQQAGLNYQISLNGKLSTLGKAVASEVSKIQESFSRILEITLKDLKALRLEPRCMISGYPVGSFCINMGLEFTDGSKNKNVFLHPEKLEDYLSHYLAYITDDFVGDVDFLKEEAKIGSERFVELRKSLSSLYQELGLVPPSEIDAFLKKCILHTLDEVEALVDSVGDNFEEMKIHKLNNEKIFPISFINREKSFSILKACERVETAKEQIEEDAEFKDYLIYIFHLNTDSRKGSAFIRSESNQDILFKPKISILGDEPLEETKYTGSLYRSSFVKVKAKAKRIGEKFKHLDIMFENDS